MAISVRGIEGLKQVDLDNKVISKAIKMYSRMLHDTSGNLSSQPYGTKEQGIYSIDRKHLNEILLDGI
jgi:hypothetical protein